MTQPSTAWSSMIRYPYAPITNGGFETGDLTGWDNRSGTFSVQSSVVRLGTYALKINPTASYGYVLHSQLISAWKSITSYPMYMYAWVRADSSSAATCSFDIYHYSNAYAYKWNHTSTITFGTGTNTATNVYVPLDGGWHFVRVGPFNTSASVSSDDRLVPFLGWGGGSQTAVVYFDDVWIGFAEEFGSWGGLGGGVGIETPYKIRKKMQSVFNKNQYGVFSARRYDTGQYHGEFKINGFNDTYRQKWKNYVDYCMDGTEFSLYYNKNDLTKYYFPRAVIAQDDDGLEQIPGTKNWSARMKWIEAIV